MAFDKYTSTASVNAEQITEQKSVITPNGPMAAQPGQWEVRYPDGNVQVVDDEQFTATFEKGEAEEEVSEEESPEVTPNAEVAGEDESGSSKSETEAKEEEKSSTEPAAKATPKAPPRVR
jgi:hypothetical protein